MAKAPAKKMKAPKGGILDDFTDRKFAEFVQRHWNTDQCGLKIAEIFAYLDNPFTDVLEAWIAGKEEQAAQFLSDFIKTMTDVSEPKAMMAAGGEVRVFQRRRIMAHLAIDARKKHPDWTRLQANTEAHKITDEQIVDAIKQAAAKHGVAGVEGISDWWQWLKDNWSWQVFLSIVGILLMFI